MSIEALKTFTARGRVSLTTGAQIASFIRMPVTQISEQGRATQGVKLIRVDEGDAIAAITNLEHEDEENGNGHAENGGEPAAGESPESAES